MSLKTKTKQSLIAYITDELGHYIHDHESSNIIDFWKIECKECNEPNEIRINSLTQMQRNKVDIVCTNCKHLKKVDKFLNKNAMTFVESYQDKDALIECSDCALQYYYNGDYFDHYRCYCKLKIKKDEHIIYKHLHDKYPLACITKEYLYHDKHKIDIMLMTDDKTFLIEIDDEAHFSDNGSRPTDIHVMNEFLRRNENNVFFVRIPTKAVNSEDTLFILDDFIETVQNNNPRILLFQAGLVNRYRFHGIPEDDCEIAQVA